MEAEAALVVALLVERPKPCQWSRYHPAGGTTPIAAAPDGTPGTFEPA